MENFPLYILSTNKEEEGNGTPLQCSCLENPMDRGAWWAAVHGVARSWTRLSDFTFTFHFHALEKGMATHSSVLAWRIPGTGEPGGLPSLGSHRVGHDWSDLAVAAAIKKHLDFCSMGSTLYEVFLIRLWGKKKANLRTKLKDARQLGFPAYKQNTKWMWMFKFLTVSNITIWFVSSTAYSHIKSKILMIQC